MPDRIQMRRVKGWRLPPGAVVVARPTPWGNPFVVGRDGSAQDCVRSYAILLAGYIEPGSHVPIAEQRACHAYVHAHIGDLAGRDLACWCRPGAPCHADVLLAAAADGLTPATLRRFIHGESPQ